MKIIKKEISLSYVLLVFGFLFFSMWYTIVYIDSWVVQIPLIASTIVACIVAYIHGYSWSDLISFILKGINIAMEGLIILLIIGMVIGSWVAGGTVQTIIVYGLDILSMEWFFPTALVISAITALATGSAWTTGGTVGVALMGIGIGLGLNPAAVAGVIISGAFFGDKLSPLSDNTNVVSAATGVNLFDHVKHTAYTAIPGITITLILFTVYGLAVSGSGDVDTSSVDLTITTLKQNFTIHPILLLPPILVLVLSFAKIPAIPSLLIATLTGSLLAITIQGISDMSVIFEMLYSGFVGNTGIESVDTIVTRGGLSSMYYNMSLALAALSFAGILEETGMLQQLMKLFGKLILNRVPLIISTMIMSWVTNLAMASQHMAMIVPGRMFLPAYKSLGLETKNLSRTLADSGGLSAPLVPYGLSGVFMAGALGVATLDYLPYVWFSFIVPCIAIVYAITGKTIKYIDKGDVADASK